jgi:DNA-binding XRE family transcriptional regulator
MSKKIAAVQTLEDAQLIVWFANGEARLLGAQELMEAYPDFQSLEGEDAFAAVTVDAEGDALAWPKGFVLTNEELLAVSEDIDIVDEECRRVIASVVKARHASNISQAKLALAAGVRQPVVARLETGVNSPRLDTLLKVLTPLGKTLRVVDLSDRDC